MVNKVSARVEISVVLMKSSRSGELAKWLEPPADVAWAWIAPESRLPLPAAGSSRPGRR